MYSQKIRGIHPSFLLESGLRYIFSTPYLLDWMNQSIGRDRKYRGPESQQVWHDKNPSLLNGHKARANAWKKPFSGNGECTIYKQDSKQYTFPSNHHRTCFKRGGTRIFKIPRQTKQENYKEKKNPLKSFILILINQFAIGPTKFAKNIKIGWV